MNYNDNFGCKTNTVLINWQWVLPKKIMEFIEVKILDAPCTSFGILSHVDTSRVPIK